MRGIISSQLRVVLRLEELTIVLPECSGFQLGQSLISFVAKEILYKWCYYNLLMAFPHLHNYTSLSIHLHIFRSAREFIESLVNTNHYAFIHTLRP